MQCQSIIVSFAYHDDQSNSPGQKIWRIHGNKTADHITSSVSNNDHDANGKYLSAAKYQVPVNLLNIYLILIVKSQKPDTVRDWYNANAMQASNPDHPYEATDTEELKNQHK